MVQTPYGDFASNRVIAVGSATTNFYADPVINRGTATASVTSGVITAINITDGGFGYDCSVDKVVIEPSNGAELKIKCDSLGSIIGVDVVKGGIGFNEDPDLYIQSDTGYNARLMPVFKVNRVGRDIGEQLVSAGDVVQVIDCVGKV